MKNKQLEFLAKQPKAYGGELMKKRKGRPQGGRPLSTQHTMHLVLRSSKAKGEWSFRRPQNIKDIDHIAKKFAKKYGIRILSLANVGNHLHFQIKLSNRFAYKPFIRAVTAAIMMAVTGVNRWSKSAQSKLIITERIKFWDYRPFTRVVDGGLRALLLLKDYIELNKLEGFGYSRSDAKFILKLSG